jgi:hypothetical protein
MSMPCLSRFPTAAPLDPKLRSCAHGALRNNDIWLHPADTKHDTRDPSPQFSQRSDGNTVRPLSRRILLKDASHVGFFRKLPVFNALNE